MATETNQVIINSWPKDPLKMDLAMNVIVRETIPVCIEICEPICIKSDYTIGIDIFGKPVASISVRGLTRVFNCKEES